MNFAFEWLTGPDAGATIVAPPGRVVIGRSHAADVRCDDHTIERYHLLIELSLNGHRVVPLTPNPSVDVDGTPVRLAADTGLRTVIDLGTSRLRITPTELAADRTETAGAHLLGTTLVRTPRQIPALNEIAVEQPRPPERITLGAATLVPTVLSVAAAGVLAAVTGQIMFVLFGALGAAVALASWAGQTVAAWRRYRRERHRYHTDVGHYEDAVARRRHEFVVHHLLITPTIGAARRTIGELAAPLWMRRRADPDVARVSLGVGDVAWHDPAGVTPVGDLRQATIGDLPVAADLGVGQRLAIRGPLPSGRAVARSLVLQLAAHTGPADLRMVVVTDDTNRWACLGALPHLADSAGAAMVIRESQVADVLSGLESATDAHIVVVTDITGALASRTSPLRRFITGARQPALIALVDGDSATPNVCTSELHIGAGPLARWRPDMALASVPSEVRWTGVGTACVAALAERLAMVVDPEDAMRTAALPNSLRLRDLLTAAHPDGITPESVAAGWVAGGTNPPPRTPLGAAADGVVDLDLVRDGPHGLLAGTTGAGKSELLRSLVVGLALTNSPDHLTFVLVDYKGGATFDACAALPHVVGLVTDLDDQLADRALRSLGAELRRREHLLREFGADDIDQLRERGGSLARLVVVIDEFAALVKEQPDFLHALISTAQRGRSLGMHLLLATQRPSGIISDDIRTNTNLRIALRVQDRSDALDVINDPAPAELPRGVPGRAVMRLSADELITFQAARCTEGDDLTELIGAAAGASTLLGLAAPPRPWQEPLADGRTIAAALDGTDGVVGVLDDPDHQRQRELRWTATGNLLIAGSQGSGVTGALVTLAAVTCRHAAHTLRPLHLYVIDAVGDDRLQQLQMMPACAAVVRLHERERLTRMIARLHGIVQQRIAAGGQAEGDATCVLLIDGIDTVRRVLDDIDTQRDYDALMEAITCGAAVGMVAVMATSTPASVPFTITSTCTERWVLHLTDANEAHMLGVRPETVPAAGRPGRLVHTTTGLAAQLAFVEPHPVPCPAEHLPLPIEPLPVAFTDDRLDRSWKVDDVTGLSVGLGFSSAATAAIEVPGGEHLLVLGPSRSGRSTALQRVGAAWLDVHPRGWVGRITPRRSSLAAGAEYANVDEALAQLPPIGSALLLVDDAELVDDPHGGLAALVAKRRSDVLVVAAGKSDALRQTYGHWSAVIRRSRLGLLAATSNDTDGDMLGVITPRRLPTSPRPGLFWLVDNGTLVLAQLALPPAGSIVGAHASSAHRRRRPDGAGATQSLAH